MLKAFYKTDLPVNNPVKPSADGLSLETYSGPPLTIGNELDKLAMNVGVGRLFGGVHWRSDHEHAVRLGELIALRVLQDLARTYNEDFVGFQVRTFGGNTLTVGATTPELPNHVSSVTGLSIVDASGQPVAGYEELKNGMALRLDALPAGWKLRVNTFPATVGSVRVVVDGGTWHDNTAPYTVDPAAPVMTPGAHVLVATPYSGANGSGLGGVPFFLRLQVVDTYWTRTGSLKTGRMNHSAVLLRNGRVLVGPSYAPATAELFNPTTGTWSYTGSTVQNRTSYTTTLLDDGKVLLVGGERGQLKPTETELYDPAAGTWAVSGSLNVGRSHHTATLLKDKRVLVLGGFAPSGQSSLTEVYDPVTQVWTTLPDRVVAAGHTATLLSNGQVLVVGGNWGQPQAWLFNPTTDTLTSIPPPGDAFINHTATLMPNGEVLVAGGLRSWLYTPNTGSWTRRGDLSVKRDFHTATLLPNGRVLLTGGDLGTELLRDAELYDPATGAWTPTAPMIDPRRNHTATLLPSGQVLIAGSNDFNAPSQSCELYTP
ncbi:kelch repeat-containing protein [Pyxidicoccus sp. 3LFB2]